MFREHRYIVFKIKDAQAALSVDDRAALDCLSEKVDRYRVGNGKSPLACVVVESDWPEYEPTWQAIERRVNGNTYTPPVCSTHLLEYTPTSIQGYRVVFSCPECVKQGAMRGVTLYLGGQNAAQTATEVVRDNRIRTKRDEIAAEVRSYDAQTSVQNSWRADRQRMLDWLDGLLEGV